MESQTPRRALVLYASQTGTAEDFSADLSDALSRLRFSVSLHSFESFDASFASLPTHHLIFLLVSTTGQGAVPDSALPLWRKLCRKRLPGDWLRHVRFGVFALGDSTYPKFCWAGRMVSRRLLQLGATELVTRVEGDQNSEEGVEGAFVRWLAEVRATMKAKFPLPEGTEELPEDVLLPPKWILELGEETAPDGALNGKGQWGDLMSRLHVRYPGSVLARVSQNSRVTTEDHWQDVRHLSLQLPSPLHWDPGDIISVSPKNFPEDVERFISLQHWENVADRTLTIKPSPHISREDDLTPCPVPFPVQPLTIRTLLMHHLDINCVPTRRFFSLAAHLTKDEMLKERLLEFTDPQWIEELWDYTTRPRRTLLEVLQEFSGVSIPLDRLLELVPRLRMRQFSIANAPPVGNQKFVDLLVAIVKYKTIIKSPRQGVCTRWLATLKPGDEVSVVLTKGSLGTPSHNVAQPAVMIAPGTGIAPVRALLQRRHPQGTDCESSNDDMLFFGCRNHDKDYFFSEEWKALEERGKLRISTAFSRDQKRKVYVQQRIRELGEQVWDVVGTKGGLILVCGSSGRMPQAVREALIEVFSKHGGLERDGAKAFLAQLERSGRYLQETWS
ncbi:riboflavin synthase domain-like protein [Ascodesmis nigricans]|uniref:NADPH-dependent diflavin oxidoreductase 1 n=1 Tax=Ascodesmis nigricans TaxID=341454 RepID=A0A4S2N0A2_9PEZI|nr:riboflavin synthase domain-like protein [Ascodesmis nigricans]